MSHKVLLTGRVLIVSENDQLIEMETFDSPVALKEELNSLRTRGFISGKRHASLLQQIEARGQKTEPAMKFR